MSVKRTPPNKNNDNMSKVRASALHYDSEPDLVEHKSDYEHVSHRTNKRRAVKTPPQSEFDNTHSIEEVMQEMRTLFSSLASQQEVRFRELQTSIQKQNEEIKESLSFLSDKYDAAMAQIETLHCEKKEDKKRIIALEDRVDFLERKSCSTSIELRNVPKLTTDQNTFEGKGNLLTFISDLGKLIDTDIREEDIKDIYRMKPTSKPNAVGTIITEFSSVLKKEKVFVAIKKFNKAKDINNKLHSGYFSIQGEKNPIYASESVTKKTAKLFSQTREFAKRNGYICWIIRGVIFLRVSDDKRVQIKSEHDLAKINSNA